MNGKQLKNSILQWAIQGKLVPQDPNDEPASVLLERIREEKERLIKEKKIKRDKNASVIFRGEDNSYYEKILATGEEKCIDEEIPFEIPQGWEWCRIASLADVVRGGSPRPAGSPIFYDGSIPFLKVADLTRESSIYVKSFSSTIKEAGLSKTRLVEAGTLLLTNSGATLGVPKICTFDTTFNDGVAAFLSLDERLKLYVYWFFCYMTDLYRNINQGTAQPNLNTDIIKMTLVPIPPYKEQIRIIEQLENISPIIAYYEKAQDELDELNESIPKLIKQSILQEAIRGKLVPQIAEEGTAKELLKQIKEEKLKLVKEGKLKKSALNDSVIFLGDDNKYYELIDNSPVCIDEFLPFQIPETWTWCKVKDLLEIQTGASFKKEQANANKKGIRILRGGNILPNKYIFKDDDVFVSEEFVNANTILKKNCIITPAVTSLENIGKMAVIEKDYNNVSAGGFVFIISPYIQDFNHSLLLAYFLQSPFLIEAMRGITKKSGAAFYNLGKERLKELYIPLPPMAEQRRIVDKINEVLSSIMSR